MLWSCHVVEACDRTKVLNSEPEKQRRERIRGYSSTIPFGNMCPITQRPPLQPWILKVSLSPKSKTLGNKPLTQGSLGDTGDLNYSRYILIAETDFLRSTDVCDYRSREDAEFSLQFKDPGKLVVEFHSNLNAWDQGHNSVKSSLSLKAQDHTPHAKAEDECSSLNREQVICLFFTFLFYSVLTRLNDEEWTF